MQPGGYWTSLNVVSEQWAMFYLGSLGPAWAPLKLLGLGVLLIFFLTNLIVKTCVLKRVVSTVDTNANILTKLSLLI